MPIATEQTEKQERLSPQILPNQHPANWKLEEKNFDWTSFV